MRWRKTDIPREHVYVGKTLRANKTKLKCEMSTVNGSRNSAKTFRSTFKGDRNDLFDAEKTLVIGDYNRIINPNTTPNTANQIEGIGNYSEGNGTVIIGDGNTGIGDDIVSEGFNNHIYGKRARINGKFYEEANYVIVPRLEEVEHDVEAGEEEQSRCTICYTNRVCCLLEECRHLILCIRCSRALALGRHHDTKPVMNYNTKCPLCSLPVTKIQRVFQT